MAEIAELYRNGRLRITELVGSLDATDRERRAPACPEWTVHDIVAHVTGVVDDALAGRLDGVATDPWTSAQVERSRDIPTADLLARWGEQAVTFERLPLPPEAVVDLATHEQDIRGAVDRPGARDSEELTWAFDRVAERTVERLPGLRIEVDGAAFGPDDAPTTLRGERYELFRALLGRRSAAQISRLDWSDGPPERIDELPLFGPAAADLIE